MVLNLLFCLTPVDAVEDSLRLSCGSSAAAQVKTPKHAQHSAFPGLAHGYRQCGGPAGQAARPVTRFPTLLRRCRARGCRIRMCNQV
jgi:hypothetical protein